MIHVGPVRLKIFCKICYRQINFITSRYSLTCLVKVTENCKFLVTWLKYIVSFLYWISGYFLKIPSEYFTGTLVYHSCSSSGFKQCVILMHNLSFFLAYLSIFCLKEAELFICMLDTWYDQFYLLQSYLVHCK